MHKAIWIVVLIILLIIYLTINNCKKEHFTKVVSHSTNINKENWKLVKADGVLRPHLWMFWDNLNGNKTPPYIKLCMETIKNKCKDSFIIHELNFGNIYDYLPELQKKEEELGLKDLMIAHQVDYFRVLLLKKYGGIYIDADIVALKDPIEVFNQLHNFDYVGFGCTGLKCNYGYGYPSNWIMVSRPNGILISRIVDSIEKKLKSFKKNKRVNKNTNDKVDESSYHEIGKTIIWKELQYLINNENYVYFHYKNDVDGTRDKYGKWVTSKRIFSNEHISYNQPDKLMFFVLYNHDIKDLKTTSEKELLGADTNFSRYVKLSRDGVKCK